MTLTKENTVGSDRKKTWAEKAKSSENVFDVLVRWYLHHHHGINLEGDAEL